MARPTCVVALEAERGVHPRLALLDRHANDFDKRLGFSPIVLNPDNWSRLVIKISVRDEDSRGVKLAVADHLKARDEAAGLGAEGIGDANATTFARTVRESDWMIVVVVGSGCLEASVVIYKERYDEYHHPRELCF